MRHFLFRFSQWLVRCCFHAQYRIEVRGQERIPRKGRLLFAVNHVSAVDPFVVGCHVPRVLFFMAKKELFEHPLLAPLVRFYNCIPIDRAEFSLSSMKRIEKLLQQDEAVLLFPEGTRTKTGKLGALKNGVAMIAARNQADIMPVYIEGLFRVRGSIFKRPRVRITFGEVVPIAPFLQNGSASKEVYGEITAKVEERLIKLANL